MQNDIINGAEVSADAITICLRTDKNTLSVWSISSDSDIEKAVLAFVSSGDNFDSFDVVCLNLESLERQGLLIEQYPMEIPYKSFKDFHFNITQLTYKSLGIVAKQITDEIKEKKDKRFRKSELKKMMKSAIESNLVNYDMLKESLKELLE